MEPIITPKRVLYGALALATLIGLALVGQIFETNQSGYVQVKQAAGTGTMSVRTTPGVYSQGFGSITTYKISDTYDFGTDNPIKVRFNDASTAEIHGQVKYRLPVAQDKIISIHTDFRSEEAVQADLIRRNVEAAVRQTASMFGAEEVYSTRRADFVQLVNEQIKNGIYATNYSETLRKDEDGNRFVDRVTDIKVDAQGRPIISEPSTFKRYDVELVQLTIGDPDFDEKTDELIAKRKEAEQEQVVAKAKAERAKQDAITAQEQGKANVAQAEAEALVVKKKAVIEAEKETEVATQQALQAEQEKKAIIARGEADAKAAALKVQAGLTPLDRANIDKETAIGVAKEMAGIKFPELLVIGGGQGNSPMNPFDAVGLKSFIDISKSISTKKE